MLREIEYKASSGISTLVVMILLTLGAIVTFLAAVANQRVGLAIPMVLALIVLLVCYIGFFIVNPGEAKALQLFGEYKGTVRKQGFWWANPFLTKKKISLRIRNFETAKLKVNDSRANPVEIAAIVVWRVVDTAEALFEVDNYATYVTVQSESAVRAVAQSYPYDSHADDEQALE